LGKLINRLRTGHSIGTFNRQIRDALTDGDLDTASKLQAERAAAEAEVQDLREALKYLRKRAGELQDEVAEASLPRLADDVRQTVDDVNELGRDFYALGQKLLRVVNAYKKAARRSDNYKRQYGQVAHYPLELPAPEGNALMIWNALLTNL
jgi:hypothetical protein